MKKTKKLISFLLVALLVFSMVTLVACKPPEDPGKEEEETEDNSDLLVNNGTFYSGTNSSGSSSYLKDTVKGWSKTSGSMSYSSGTLGVVDLSADKFKENGNVLHEGLANPGIAPSTPKVDGIHTDNNALVVGLPETAGSVYYKTSSSVTLEKGKYYKLSIDAYTDLLDNESDMQGAWIFINSGAYVEFAAINTNKEWKTYEIYIEANDYENRTIYIELWLGHGPKYLGTSSDTNLNPRSTKGFAFFDNVILTKSDKADDYKAVLNNDTFKGKEQIVGRQAVLSLIYADKDFTYESKITSISPSSSTSKVYYSAKSGAANNYTMIVGKEDAETSSEFPTYSSAYSTTGIFDMSKFWNPTYKEDKTIKDSKEWVDDYNIKNTDFAAPSAFDFYNTETGKYQIKGRTDVLTDSEALLISHPKNTVSGLGYKSSKNFLIEANKYYKISVMTYIWTPAFDEKAPTEPALPTIAELGAEPDATDTVKYPNGKNDEKYIADLAEYTKNKKVWDKYNADKVTYDNDLKKHTEKKNVYDARAALASSTFKISGVSIDKSSLIKNSEPGLTGKWQELAFYVRGNELSNRRVNFEFWYGEGEWESDTLMVGGAMFDSIKIESSNEELPGESHEYETLSPLTDEEIDEFGLTTTMTQNYQQISTGNPSWTYDFEDSNTDKTSAEAGIIKGEAAIDEKLWGANPDAIFQNVAKPGTLSITKENKDKVNFNVVMMYNKAYTATTLKYLPKDGKDNKYIEIAPNSFYRLSIWIKTVDIGSGLGLKVELFDKDDVSLTSLSGLNTEDEWTELSFYLRGSTTKLTNAYLKFTMGSGDVYTPASHVKGISYITAMTFKNISYTEFNSASSGTYIATKTIGDTTSSDKTVTNGNFNNLDTSNYTKEEKIFDDNGKLVGIAAPSSWTLSSGVNALDKPTGLELKEVEGKQTLTWTAVPHAEKYYIYMDKVPTEEDGKTVYKNDVIVAITTEPKWVQTVFSPGNFKVRAIRETADADGAIGSSPFSSTKNNTNTNGDKTIPKIDDPFTVDAGVVDYTGYKDLRRKAGMTAEEDIQNFYLSDRNSFEYISTKSNNLLMVSSENNYTRAGYTMSSSQSISADTFYMLSVWVKTIGDATASITINNTSNVFTRSQYEGEDYAKDGDYVGYVNQSTGDQWKQYRFYIKTTVNSANLKLELFLGNKYAVATKDKEEKPNTITNGLSKGTVFFDDISFVTLDNEEAFNELFYGVKDPATETPTRVENKEEYLNTLDGEFFANTYRFKLLNYTTDSFDIFTAPTDDSPQGGKSGGYTHYVASGGEDYDEDDKEAAMLYGIYDGRKIATETLDMFKASTSFNPNNWFGEEIDTEKIKDFMKTGSAMGDNFLFMANLKNNGQSYTGTSVTISAESYYKIVFYAKTMIPAGKYGEFRFINGDDSEKYESIRITSENATGKTVNGLTEYAFYVHNPRTASVSSNKLAFYLGSNESKASDSEPTNFFPGMMVVDNVSITKLIDDKEYVLAKEAYNNLSAEEKLVAGTTVFEYTKTPEKPEEEEPKTEDPTFNSQLWLIISSVIIGAILIAVIIILTYRKIKKKIKKKIPTKVISNVPVNQVTAEERKALANKANNKNDITDDNEFED